MNLRLNALPLTRSFIINPAPEHAVSVRPERVEGHCRNRASTASVLSSTKGSARTERRYSVAGLIMVSAAVILASLGAAPALAQSGHAGHDSHHHGHAPAQATAGTDTNPAAPLSEGTVRRVNAEAGSVTIAHGPLANLDMPPMTMSFQLRGNASLDGLAPGDRIRFAADQDGDAFIVTEIEKLGE